MINGLYSLKYQIKYQNTVSIKDGDGIFMYMHNICNIHKLLIVKI